MANISVIVPVYKVEEFLSRCVDSILCQSYSDFDLILVDDGSPDRCGQMCEDYARQEGCKYLRLDTNSRNTSARALYKSMGYEEIGCVPCVFNGLEDVNLVLIEKAL